MAEDASAVERRLVQAMAQWQVIDCHEHLGPEESRTGRPADLFTLFSFEQYIGADLLRAGMKLEDYRALLDCDAPLERRWAMFEPWWELVRHTSYARAILLGAERFYGALDISAANCAALSEAVAEANRPGLYQRVLRDACRIRLAINDSDAAPMDRRLFVPVVRVDAGADLESWEGLTHLPFAPDARIATLDDLLEVCKAHVLRSRRQGAVGLKTVALDYGEPDRAAAEEAFRSLKSGAVERLSPPVCAFPMFGRSNPLRDFVVDQILAYAGELGMAVAVHTGYWGDFRRLDPLHIIPMLMRHPQVRFDVFHLGFPWIRQTLMLAKGFSNVWLNLCWTHVISQRAAMDAVDEAIDLIPANKVLAFGGDVGAHSVEMVYGHLVMARQDVAGPLARRVAAGRMTEDQALALARRWFVQNPVELYGLSTE